MADDRLVIFDCDGVLVDSERLTVAIEARMLTEPVSTAQRSTIRIATVASLFEVPVEEDHGQRSRRTAR